MIVIEKVLEKVKYTVYIPVVTLLIIAVLLFIYAVTVFFSTLTLEYFAKEIIISNVISIIDLIFLGILSLMISASLYELYVKEVDKIIKLPETLIVKSLDSLKEKLGKVIYLLLVIFFFKYSLEVTIDTNIDLMLYALSILLISLSLYFSKK